MLVSRFKLLFATIGYMILSSFSCDSGPSVTLFETTIIAPSYPEYKDGYYVIQFADLSTKKIPQGYDRNKKLLFDELDFVYMTQLSRECNNRYPAFEEGSTYTLEGKPYLDILHLHIRGSSNQSEVIIDNVLSPCPNMFGNNYFEKAIRPKRDTVLQIPVYPDQYNALRARRNGVTMFSDSIYIGKDIVLQEIN